MHLLLHIVILRCNVISPVLRPVVQKKRHDSESDVELELFRYCIFCFVKPAHNLETLLATGVVDCK